MFIIKFYQGNKTLIVEAEGIHVSPQPRTKLLNRVACVGWTSPSGEYKTAYVADADPTDPHVTNSADHPAEADFYAVAYVMNEAGKTVETIRA